MKMKEILEKNIAILKLENKITNKLLENKIDTIFKLCNYTRVNLVNLKFRSTQINDIIIRLQLLGLDLKKNHAKRNTTLDGLV